MSSESKLPIGVGQVLDNAFPTFAPRDAIHSERKLTVEIVAGEGVGFSDTVEYEAIAIRDGVVLLSGQEHIGSKNVLDLFLPGGGRCTLSGVRGARLDPAGVLPALLLHQIVMSGGKGKSRV